MTSKQIADQIETLRRVGEKLSGNPEAAVAFLRSANIITDADVAAWRARNAQPATSTNSVTTTTTQLPGMENVQVIVSAPQLVRENSQYSSTEYVTKKTKQARETLLKFPVPEKYCK